MWLDAGYIFDLTFDWKKTAQSLGNGDQPLSLTLTPEFAPPVADQRLPKIVIRTEYEIPNAVNPQGPTAGFWPVPFTPRIISLPPVPESYPRFLLIKLIRPRSLRFSPDPLAQVPIIDVKLDYKLE